MKKIKLGLLCGVLVLAFGCKNDKKNDASEATDKVEEVVTKEVKEVKVITLDVALESRSESTAAGTVYLKDNNGTVSLSAKIGGLDPGTHAIHIHEKADCSSADGKSSGGHWNPTFEAHGKWGAAEGYHKGDIGNFEANENGDGQISFETDEWCIGCGDEKKDLLGKAIVVHQGTDDFTSQPSGAAGARVSCGGVIQ